MAAVAGGELTAGQLTSYFFHATFLGASLSFIGLMATESYQQFEESLNPSHSDIRDA